MLNLQLARKYSRAIFELAQDEGKLVPYGEELASVLKDLNSVPGVWGYFSNPELSRDDKKALVKKMYDGELSTDVYHFLLLLVDKRRMTLLPAIVEQYEALSNEARHIIVADVTTARPLSAAQKDK
ncbi:ATP synthase F1 subunit delta, partial [Selenomonas sp.]